MAFPRSPGDQKLSLHARCEIARLGSGEILFVGQTSFAPGVWVGVELDDPNGKNNGVVQGKRYFECQDGHGVFVRPSQVHMLPQEAEEEEEGDLELEEEPEPVPVRRVAPRTASPKKPVPGPSVGLALSLRLV